MENGNGPPAETEIGKRIRAARGYKGLSQPELAKAIGCGRVHVTDMEMGRDEPDDGELYLIARACDLPMEFFSVDWSSLSEPIAATDLFDVLHKIKTSTDLIPQGLTYLEGLVSDDILNKMKGDGEST